MGRNLGCNGMLQLRTVPVRNIEAVIPSSHGMGA